MDNQQDTTTSLTVNDLIFIKQLLEIVTKRGAFSAEELTTVGAFYDKLTGFLTATEAQAQAAAANAPAAADAAQPVDTPAPADATAPAEGE